MRAPGQEKEDQLRKLVDCIYVAHQDDQLDCDTCGAQVAVLAERVANGGNLHELWPEFEAHLACCKDCFEEFNALLCILKADEAGALSDRIT